MAVTAIGYPARQKRQNDMKKSATKVGVKKVEVAPAIIAAREAPDQVVKADTIPAALMKLYDLDTQSTSLTNDRTVGVFFRAAAAQKGWLLSETQSERPVTLDHNKEPVLSVEFLTEAPTTFTLSEGDGLKTVYGWTITPAGVVSQKAVVWTITLDTTTRVRLTSSSPSYGMSDETISSGGPVDGAGFKALGPFASSPNFRNAFVVGQNAATDLLPLQAPKLKLRQGAWEYLPTESGFTSGD